MSLKFEFHLPTKIEFGTGLINQVGQQTKRLLPGRRAMLVTDQGIKQVGIADRVLSSLADAGFTVEFFDRVEPNPKDVDCEAGGLTAIEFGADVIVAVGGGSVMDSAKAIALLQTHKGRLAQYEGRGKVTKDVTPIIAIPTTSGTGSEVTRSSVVTDTTRRIKMSVRDLRLAPRLALVDPETTYALPATLTATTGMDALVHAIEAYTCRAANAFSDIFAQAAMGKIFPWLRTAVHHGNNEEARTALMLGSLLAGVAFSHADVAAVHCLAEALGGLYDIPHGAANSIFFPAVTAYNAAVDPKKHKQAAAACGLPVDGLTDEEASLLLVNELKKLSQEIGIPTFASYDCVKEEDFAFLAEASERNGSTPSNCRLIDKAGYLTILEKVLHEN
jgi:alcohol dehydrogenase